MTIKCWRTSKCEHIDTYVVDHIDVMSGNAEEDRESIKMGCTPLLGLEMEDGGFMFIPIPFVIEIND